MIGTREFVDLKTKLDRSTHGAWVVTYNASKEPRIESSVGVVVVPTSYTMTKEDAELIAAMHETLPRLITALEHAERARLDAVHALELEQNNHMNALRRMMEHSDDLARGLNHARDDAAALSNTAARQERELVETHRKVDAMTPLVEAVEQWVRTRHSPRLLAAWDRYAACAKP